MLGRGKVPPHSLLDGSEALPLALDALLDVVAARAAVLVEHHITLQGLLPSSQDQNLVLTAAHVPSLIGSFLSLYLSVSLSLCLSHAPPHSLLDRSEALPLVLDALLDVVAPRAAVLVVQHHLIRVVVYYPKRVMVY